MMCTGPTIQRKGTVLAVVVVLLYSTPTLSQRFIDNVLFSISLSSDSSSLFFTSADAPVSRTLAGPVLMDPQSLLFHGFNGYALYSTNGTLLDSQVYRNDAHAAHGEKRLLYPLDSRRLLFLEKDRNDSNRIVIKKITKKRYHKCRDERIAALAGKPAGQLFNVCGNYILDPMREKLFLTPRCVGFSHQEEPHRHWWCLEKHFSFTSPLFHESTHGRGGFFKGITSHRRIGRGVHLLDPLAVSATRRGDRYVGIYAPLGTETSCAFQTLYFCDNAGNFLFSDSLLLQQLDNVSLGESETTVYTVRKIIKRVYQPFIGDAWGSVYYGIVDFRNLELEVHCRRYFRYDSHPSPGAPNLLLDEQERFVPHTMALYCNPLRKDGKTIPRMSIRQPGGSLRKARIGDLSTKGFLARLSRTTYRDIHGRIARVNRALPESVRAIQDSLARRTTTWCPYTVTLSNRSGVKRAFDYGSGETVVCARVVNVVNDSLVFVRVDCEEWAEMLVLTVEGDFYGRFVFNTQHWETRRDIIAVDDDGTIVERDGEHKSGNTRLLVWTTTFPAIGAP